jgi:hypothetical protein
MADNAFDFNQAPSNTAGRQFGAVAGIAKLAGLGKKSSGLSARQQSNLMRQQAGHAIDSQLIGHVLGENAAGAAHKRSMQATRLGNKHELAKSAQEHLQNTDVQINTQNHEARMAEGNRAHEVTLAGVHHENAMNAIEKHAGNSNISSIKLPNGASAQFNRISKKEPSTLVENDGQKDSQ